MQRRLPTPLVRAMPKFAKKEGVGIDAEKSKRREKPTAQKNARVDKKSEHGQD